MKKDRRGLYCLIFCLLMISYSFLFPYLGVSLFLGEWIPLEESLFGIWSVIIPAIVTFISIFVIVIVKIKDNSEQKEIKDAILNSGIEQIDNLSPFEFEAWVANFLSAAGYTTKITKKSGDYGVDVIAKRDYVKIAVQVKKYTKDVGIKAVQEVISGMSFYDCNEGCVITSAPNFTKAAKNLADTKNIKLINRTDLAKMLNKMKNKNSQ